MRLSRKGVHDNRMKTQKNAAKSQPNYFPIISPTFACSAGSQISL